MHQFGYKFLFTKPGAIYLKYKSLEPVELDGVIKARNKRHAINRIRRLYKKNLTESDFLFLGRVCEWVRSLCEYKTYQRYEDNPDKFPFIQCYY